MAHIIRPIEFLRGAHKDQTAALVGGGPSIRHLSPAHLAGCGLVVALNYALNKVRALRTTGTVYTMQKDLLIIQPLPPEVLLIHKHESAKEFPGYEPAFVFDNHAFGLAWDRPSCLSALKILEIFGAARARCVAFDSVTHKDLRACRDGVNIVPKNEMNWPPDAYLNQAAWMVDATKTAPFEVEWITPCP
jgi:hypothetical protein